jgi:pterin-4a-carbinolamine dehydratase
MKNLKIEKEVEERCNKYFSKYEKRLDEMENKLDKKIELDEVKALIQENKESAATGGNDQDGTLTSQLSLYSVLLNLTQERQKCFSQYSHSSTSALSSVNLTEQTLHVHPSVLNAFPLVEVTEPLRDMVQISTGDFRLCNREALLIFEPQLMQGSLAHKILYKNK